MIRRRFALPFAVVAASFATVAPITRAQDLSAELDSIEDPPEDDLSDLDGPGTGKGKAAKPQIAKPQTAKPSAGGEDLPPDGEPDGDDIDLSDLDPPADEDAGAAGTNDLSGEAAALNDRPAEALTGTATSGPVGKVVSFGFKQLADRVRLTVKSDRSIEWARELRSKRRQIIVELKSMTIARGVLKRALDTGEFEGPVALIQPYESRAGGQPSVKILFQLRQFVEPTVLRSGNDLLIDFPIVTDGNLFKGRAAATPTIPRTFLSATGPMDFRGNKITLNVKNAEIQDVLNLISRASGKDFILAATANGSSKVTLNVRNTPWDQVLSVVLLNAKLGYQEIGNTYRIVPISELKSEIEDASKAQSEELKLRSLETRLFPVNYAEAAKVQENLRNFLTKDRGTIAVDARTNSIVVTDLPEILERISRYIRSIDKQTSQVLIEGRIVEATQRASKQFQVQWDTTAPGSRSLLVSGATLPRTNSNFGGELGAQFGIGNFLGIRAALRMLEDNGESKTIGSPRVTVLDNEEATISQGQRVQLVTQGAAGVVTTSYQDATLELKVRPQVTSDGYVLLDIKLKRDVPGASQQIETRSASTQMLVESGKTAVIGGIYTDNTRSGEQGWPGLMNLPIFGSIFRSNTNKSKEANELMMFISPKILNADKAFIVRSQNFEEQEERAEAPSLRSQDEDVPDDVF